MHFLAVDLHKRLFKENFFDEIMFAGTVHQLTDELLFSLLQELHFCLKFGGRIHLLDPVLPDGDYGLQRFMRLLRRGRYPRSATPVTRARLLPPRCSRRRGLPPNRRRLYSARKSLH